MSRLVMIGEEVAAALAAGTPVVGLESTVISHGLPRPRNRELAAGMEGVVRSNGAVPATVGVLDCAVVVGLTTAQIDRLAAGDDVVKVSRRNLAAAVAAGRPGATTVAATMWALAVAGIEVMATGGIGGVHRGAEETFDISADIAELARTPVTVVCSGAKIILDLPRTLEALETGGVPVVGYRTDRFPAFYSVDSGLTLDQSVQTAEEAAGLVRAQRDLGLDAGIVIANPPPADAALSRDEVEVLIDEARSAAATAGVRGTAVTPFLLDHLARATGGRSVEANVALLLDNARVAASIAAALAG